MSQQQNDNNNGDTSLISKSTLFQVMQREITNIGKALTCPICQSTYTNPVLLPCVHAFCHQCILSSFQHRHQCPCCKRTCQKRSIIAAEGLETMCRAYKSVVRNAAFTSIEYDEACLAMTQIEQVASSQSQHDLEEEDVQLHLQVGQTWLEQLSKSGNHANEVLKRQQEAVVAVDERVLQNFGNDSKPAAVNNNTTNSLQEDSQGNAFCDAKEEETVVMDETMQDITTVLENQNLIKTPAGTTTNTRDETCRRTNKTATTTTSDDAAEPSSTLQVLKRGAGETTTTSSPARDESQQQYSESAAFYTADEDEQNQEDTQQDETSLTAPTTATTVAMEQVSKEHVPCNDEDSCSVPREVQVTFLSSIHEEDAVEEQEPSQQGGQVLGSTLPTESTTTENVGESTSATAASSGVDKETVMDVDETTTPIPDNTTMADALQTTFTTDVQADAENEAEMEISKDGAASMPASANKDEMEVPVSKESQTVARDERMADSLDETVQQETCNAETVGEESTRSDARRDQDKVMADAKDTIQADDVLDEPMPDADKVDDSVNLEAPIEGAVTYAETQHDAAGAVTENPPREEGPMPDADGDDVSEEEPMPEADGEDVDSGGNQDEEAADPEETGTNAAHEESAASLEETESTPPSVSTFAVGTIVQVEDRCWPGINKQGGVGRVTKVHIDGGSILYDVAYVLGGREKKVEAVFVSEQDLEQKRNRSPKSSEKANLSPELLASLAADGFDTEGKVRLEQAREGDTKVGAKRKALDQNKSNEQGASRSGKKKRPRKGKTAAAPTKKKRAHHGAKQSPSELTDDQKRENADTHYNGQFQTAESQSIISVVASSLPEHEMSTLQLLCKETKNQDVKVRTTETFNPSKTTLVVVAVDAKSNSDNLASRTRTLKVMRAILAGVPIVSPSWISSCLEAGKVISPSPEQCIRTVPVKTNDPAVDANLGVSLLAARMYQENSQLLSNVRVLLCGQFVSSQGSPRKADIQVLLRESGASVFTSEGGAMNKLKKVGDDGASKVVLLCDECPNNTRCGISTGLAKEVKDALERDDEGVIIVNSMWLFDSISCGQMAPPQPFKPRSTRAQDLWKLSS